MKVKVNKDLCIGCGACQQISNNTFEIEDDYLAGVKVDSVNEDDIEDVKDAIESCPTSAIEEVED